MALYFRDIRRFPRPTADQEIEWAKQIEQGGPQGEEAREQMITAYLCFVVYMAKRFQGRGLDLLDLIQEGNLGLIRAVGVFDWRYGFRFTTLAAKSIEQCIRWALTKNSKYADHVADTDWATYALISASGGGATQIEEAMILTALRRVIERTVKGLGPKEHLILKRRFGLDCSETFRQREIAEQLGVSRQYVQQVEKRALKKFHSRLTPFRGYGESRINEEYMKGELG